LVALTGEYGSGKAPGMLLSIESVERRSLPRDEGIFCGVCGRAHLFTKSGDSATLVDATD
jgi:hypothetical protein